jgi:hypothetical protein
MRFKILIALGAGFIISMLIACIINNSFGWSLMGVFLFGFLFYALYMLFRIISPHEFASGMFERAGDDIKKPKYWGNLFVLSMVGIGIFWLFISVFTWFIFYV